MSPDVEKNLLRHRRGWLPYWQGIDATYVHQGGLKCPYDDRMDAHSHNNDPKAGDAWSGFWKWVKGFFARAYSQDDDGTPYEEDTYLSPWSSRKLEVHEAGHTKAFGGQFPLHPDGTPNPLQAGLEHEPTATLDIMVSGPGSLGGLLRRRDERGLQAKYDEWEKAGRIKTIEEY